MFSALHGSLERLTGKFLDRLRLWGGDTLEEVDTMLTTYWVGGLTLRLKRRKRGPELYVSLAKVYPGNFGSLALTAGEFAGFAENVERARDALKKEGTQAPAEARGSWFSGHLVQTFESLIGPTPLTLRLKHPAQGPYVDFLIGRANEANAPIPMTAEEFEDFAGSVRYILGKLPTGALPPVE